MKKIVSLFLALIMVVSCFTTIAFAEEFEFELALLDADMENDITEINVGESFMIGIASSTKTNQFGVVLAIDTTAFSFSKDESDFGYHAGSLAVDPDGVVNTLSVGGIVTGKTRAIDSYVYVTALKAGTYDIEFVGQRDSVMPEGSTSTATPEKLTIKVLGGEDDKTPAEKINLLTANGVAKSDVYVTNNDGTKYYVDSALVFVSSVDKGNAPVKTVITCDDFADTKLEIEATHTQDINGLTYFAAAMSSIKETNYGRTFKATAYVTNTAGEEVVGAPATGIFTK